MITATTRIIRAQARIMAVDSVPLGSELTADTPAGATTLTVVNAVDYPRTGTVSLNGEVLDYTAVDDPTGTLTLAGVTTADAFEGDRVALWNADISDAVAEKRAIVQFDGDAGSNDPIIAVVAQNLVASLPEGIRSQVGESVIIEYEHGTWRVVDVLGTARIPLTGDLKVYDDVGTWRTTVGRQSDGTYTTIDVNAPPPPVPAAPSVDTQPGVAVIASYGTTVDGSDWPLDFKAIEAHVGSTSGFVIGAGSKVADWGPDGGSVTVALDEGTWYVVLVAVNTSGIRSDASVEVSAAVPAAATSGGVKTYRTNEAPTGLAAVDDGALWYDTDAGNLPHRWDGSTLTWVAMPFGGDALADDAVDGKTIVGGTLEAGALNGGSIAIATVTAGTDGESFSGTTFPAGWADEVYSTLADVPGASVTSTGVPTGSDNGSAMLVDLGPADNPNTGIADKAEGAVVSATFDAVDCEVLSRVYLSKAFPSGSFTAPAERLAVFLRASGDLSDWATVDCLMVEFGWDRPRVVSRVGASDSTLDTLSVILQPGWWNVRAKVIAGQLYVTVWPDGDTEPAATFVPIDQNLNPGAAGVHWQVYPFASAATIGQKAYFDTFDVTTFTTGFVVNPDGVVRASQVDVSGSLTVSGPASLSGTVDVDAPASLSGETWHTVGAAGEPGFQNGCSAQNEAVQFRKDAAGNVWMRGRVNLGAGAGVMFTLPAGYRPSVLVGAACIEQGETPRRVQVNADGTVQAVSATAGNWLTLPVGFSALA